jgi:hypothetical protein
MLCADKRLLASGPLISVVSIDQPLDIPLLQGRNEANVRARSTGRLRAGIAGRCCSRTHA